MTWAFAEISFTPLVPWPLILVPAAVLAVLAGLALVRRARGAWWRLLPLAALIAALVNPHLAGEERHPLDDIVMVLVDDSASQGVGERRTQSEAALAGVQERLARQPGLEVRVERLPPTPGVDEGTRLFSGLERALSDVPRRRLAGVIAITDGQVHDVPQAGGEKDIGAPLHVLLTGRKGERDRRVVVEQAPSFGIVGSSVTITVRVDELGATGNARVTLRRDGGRPVTTAMPLNVSRQLEIPIEHGGPTVVEIEAEAGAEELSKANNRAAVTVNGVRDRLRVLLISGEPHPGERTWRNLLKADPSVDLVHFTILRPPEKDDATPLKELALISFPIRELFEEKLSEFDLVIFDRYRRRSLMPIDYYANIAAYVRGGGALLMAVGPEVQEGLDMHSTPLEEVLPAKPDGSMIGEGFVPMLTELGRRHPVTAGLPGGEGQKPTWGRWLRVISSTPGGGMEVMTGAHGLPVLMLNHVGEGRVAMLLSDTVWLWDRGFEGGGPQAELLRRIAHWSMKEPDLEEETLSVAVVDGTTLAITRRTMDDAIGPVQITRPDGSTATLRLDPEGAGRFSGRFPAPAPGLYRLAEGELTRVVAVGPAAPREFEQTVADAAALDPLVAATQGAVLPLSEGVPDLRTVVAGRQAHGQGIARPWIAITPRGAEAVEGLAVRPLLPPWAWLALIAGLALAAWLAEGGRLGWTRREASGVPR